MDKFQVGDKVRIKHQNKTAHITNLDWHKERWTVTRVEGGAKCSHYPGYHIWIQCDKYGDNVVNDTDLSKAVKTIVVKVNKERTKSNG